MPGRLSHPFLVKCGWEIGSRRLLHPESAASKRLAVGEPVVARRRPGSRAEQAVKMAQVLEPAVEGDLEDALLSHLELAPGIGDADAVDVVGGRLREMPADDAGDMLPAASAEAEEALDAAGKVFRLLDRAAGLGQPIRSVVGHGVTGVAAQLDEEVEENRSR